MHGLLATHRACDQLMESINACRFDDMRSVDALWGLACVPMDQFVPAWLSLFYWQGLRTLF